jgi:membrane-associated phospholipid phosphatase
MAERGTEAQDPTPEDIAVEPTPAPTGPRMGTWFVAGAVGAVVVSWGAGELISSSPSISGWDRSILRWLAEHRENDLTDAMRAITQFGNTTVVMLLLGIVVGAAYLRTLRERWLVFFVATVVGAFLLDNLVKLLVQRPRPSFGRITEVSGPAFPSGHSTMAAALFVATAFVASQWLRGKLLVAVWVVASCLAALVGFSRAYLGAHWATDVFFGLGLGVFWTIAMARACGIWPLSEMEPLRDSEHTTSEREA